jgi:hypothetical protein
MWADDMSFARVAGQCGVVKVPTTRRVALVSMTVKKSLDRTA